MSALRWVLHIGLHKTGTSAVQNRLAAHRGWLADRGVLYPATGHGVLRHPTSPSATQGHNAFAHAIRAGDEAKFAALVAALEQERAAAGARTVIVSSELLSAPACTAAPAWWRRVIPPDAEIVVVTFLRRQDRWIESYYKEVLGWGGVRETRAIDTFVAEEGPALLDYAARLAPWARAFGRGAVRVYSYDDVAGRVLDRLLEAAGHGALGGELALPEPDANPSLDGRLTGLLRACNAVLDLDRSAKKKLTSLLLAVDPGADGRGCSILSHALRCSLAARYRESNRELARGWITGPAERFQFPDDVEAVPLCRQLYTGRDDLS